MSLFKRPYNLIRFDAGHSTLEIRQHFDDAAGHWHITGHWKDYSFQGGYHNTGILAYDQNHPKIRNSHEDDYEQDQAAFDNQIESLAYYASGQGYHCPQAEIVELIKNAINELDNIERAKAARNNAMDLINNPVFTLKPAN